VDFGAFDITLDEIDTRQALTLDYLVDGGDGEASRPPVQHLQ
jgi:hypothetical protein